MPFGTLFMGLHLAGLLVFFLVCLIVYCYWVKCVESQIEFGTVRRITSDFFTQTEQLEDVEKGDLILNGEFDEQSADDEEEINTAAILTTSL